MNKKLLFILTVVFMLGCGSDTKIKNQIMVCDKDNNGFVTNCRYEER